ncbi:MAG: vacuolar family H+-ATPase subunit H, partial [Lachnospiraceae bacterium]|nr:vacuolar family H+-ATPase subunit H [Lachnospiraceae bacterium]
GCKFQPLSTTKIIVNKDEIDELLRELRLKTPDEIKKYQKIIANKDAILNDAKDKSDAMISEATAHITELVSEHEIMQKAYKEANAVVEQAQREAEEILNNATIDANNMRMGAVQYTDSILAEIQSILSNSMNNFENIQNSMMSSLSSSLDVVVGNRKELSNVGKEEEYPVVEEESEEEYSVDLD